MKLKFASATRAMESLGQILDEPYSVIVRDASIQRFEYTFEAVWKFLKEFLKSNQGVVCNAPKACFREILAQGLLSEEEAEQCLEMTDRRNQTSHTYNEEVAQLIYGQIAGYYRLMKMLLDRIDRII